MSDEPSSSIKEEFAKALGQVLQPSAKSLGSLFALRLQYLEWRSAIKVLEKVKQKVSSTGDVSELPPIKTFIPLLEGAALEQHDNTFMQDMWANLLIAEIKQNDENTALYVDLLKKINKQHIDILLYLLRGKDCSYWENIASELSVRNVKISLEARPPKKYDIDYSKFALSHNDVVDYLNEKIKELFTQPGTCLLSGSGHFSDSLVEASGVKTRILFDEDFEKSGCSYEALHALKVLGLVHIDNVNDYELLKCVLEFEYVRLSEIGVQLLYRCVPDKISEKYFETAVKTK